MKCKAIKRDGNLCGRRVKDGHDVCGHHTEEHRAKTSAATSNPSTETRAKMSEARIGEKSPMFGKPKSAETRAKMSKAQTGKPKSADARLKTSIGLILHNHPEWTREQAIDYKLSKEGSQRDYKKHGPTLHDMQGGCCLDCKIPLRHPKDQLKDHPGELSITGEIHHLVYQRNGGSDRIENLVMLCKTCHMRRHRLDPDGQPLPPDAVMPIDPRDEWLNPPETVKELPGRVKELPGPSREVPRATESGRLPGA